MIKQLLFIIIFLLIQVPVSPVLAQAGGDLDPTFAQAGMQTVHVGAFDQASGLLVDGLGNTMVYGQTADFTTQFDLDALLIKLDADGQLVSGFGDQGVQRFDFPGQFNSRILDGVLHQDRLYLIGESNPNASLDSLKLFIGCFDLNGQPDPTFGTGGYFQESFGTPFCEAASIRVDTAGRVVFSGTLIDTVGQHTEYPLVGRLLPNGQRDTTFGQSGVVIWSILDGIVPKDVMPVQAASHRHNEGAVLRDLLLLDEHYFCSGFIFFGETTVGFSLMLQHDGTIEPTFGFGGTFSFDFSPGYNSWLLRSFVHNDTLLLAGQKTLANGRMLFHVQEIGLNGALYRDRTPEFSGNTSWLADALYDGQDLYLAGGSATDPATNPNQEPEAVAVVSYDSDLELLADFGDNGEWLKSAEDHRETGATALAEFDEDRLLVAATLEGTDSANYTDIQLMRIQKGAPNSVGVAFATTQTETLTVFPNPCQQELNISTTNQEPYWIVSATGQLMATGKLSSTLDTSQLPAGVYWLETNSQKIVFVKQ